MQPTRVFVVDGVEVFQDTVVAIDTENSMKDPRPKPDTAMSSDNLWLFVWDHYDVMKNRHVFRGFMSKV